MMLLMRQKLNMKKWQNSKVLLRYTELTKDEMANSIGKTDRAAIAICDEGFKKAILKILIIENPGGGLMSKYRIYQLAKEFSLDSKNN